MKKIILLSGHSQRFTEKGYPIKPLIEINKKLVIDYVVESIKEQEENYNNYIFVVKDTDVRKYNLSSLLQNRFKGCIVFTIKEHTLGPVYSVMQIFSLINDEEEVLISYCDLYIKWNVDNFISNIKNQKSDGCVVSHTGWHPHRIYNNSFAYMKVDREKMLEIKEKQPYTNTPVNEYASGGIYYFRKGLYIKNYFKKLYDSNEKVNNEFYVTMTYNLMIKDGLNVTHYDSQNYVCLGTPKDVELFNAFLILNKELNVEDETLLKAKNYFKQYLQT